MSAFYSAVARFYDSENADKVDDLALYLRLAQQHPGEVLDIGCGTGRVLIHLAGAGFRVHGIDNDRAMLEIFRRKLETLPQLRDLIHIVEADVFGHDYSPRFRLIFLSYNAMMHFHDQAAQINLLRRLRGWLREDGLLIIDLPNAAPAFAAPDTDTLTVERTFLDPESGHMVMLQSINAIDRAAQMLDVEWIYDMMDGEGGLKRMVVPHRLRYYFLPEMQLLLERCAFQIQAVYGDADQSPYDAESERMIVFAAPD